MHNMRFRKHRYGFSLIEVLVAVAVLAFGLLALAALQVKLMRASADSKAQTVGLSLAKDKVEDLRTFRNIAAYQALDGRAAPVCPSSDSECISIGGVDYRRSWSVARYVFNGAAFVTTIANTAAVPATYPTNNEFKRIQVTVAWNDADGTPQSIAMEDAIGALDPTDSTRLVKLSKTVTPRRPRAVISDPALTAGIIPIAIGNNTDTAATNPRPEVAGRNNSERVVETRFDVLTYSAGAVSGTAVEQSRIETAVVGCTCDTATGGGAAGLRPTFWDGERYTVPKVASFAPPAGHAVLGNNDPPDSQLCDICCRDHHDNSSAAPTRIASVDAKFDPRRSVHDHFVPGSIVVGADSTATGTLATGRYQEACRVIRVDGIFRVAADTYNDYFNLLETASNSTSPVPSSSATSNYQGFVLDYMKNRVVSNTNSATYDTPSTGLPAANQTALNNPASIDINATSDFKWLHSRGLYMDYLEPVAIARIEQAKTDCANRLPSSCTASELSAAVLRLVPFTSINLTELANWTPAGSPDDTNQIVVTNNDFLSSLNTNDPVRGKVASGARPVPGSTPTAFAEIFHSNSGLALLLDAIDPQEASPLQDSQAFRVTGTASTSGGKYLMSIASYPFPPAASAYPTLTPTPAANCNFSTKGSTKPNPYTCTTSSIGVATSIVVGRYNYQQSSSSGNVTCTSASGPSVTHALTNKESINVCKNFLVLSATPGGAVGAVSSPNGAMAETTTLNFASIVDGAAITVKMFQEADTIAPYTCTYSGSTFTVAASNCP